MEVLDLDLCQRKGTVITLVTKENVLKKGLFLGITPDRVLIMEFHTDEALVGLLETECDDVLDIY